MVQECDHPGFPCAQGFLHALMLTLFFLCLTTMVMAASTPQVGMYYFDGWASTSSSNFHIGSMPEKYPGREPLTGWYDNSAAILHQQIKWARSTGVTFFIFDWYDLHLFSKGPDQTDNSAMTLFRKDPHKLGLKYALLYVNNGHLSIPQSAWKSTCEKWVKKDFKNPGYFKIKGKPLLVVFSFHNMERTWGGPQGVAHAWSELRQLARKAGIPGVYVVACATAGGEHDGVKLNRLDSEGYSAYSGYNYPGVPGTLKGQNPYSVLIRGSRNIWNGFAAQGHKPYIPVVTDGWDSRPWNETPYWYARTPAELRDFVVDAFRWWHDYPRMRVMKKTPLIFVEAWNELGEGSYVIPTRGEGFTFLKALKQGIKEGKRKW